MTLATTHLTATLLELAFLFGLNIAVGWAFLRLRMPPMVGFLAAGALIGPHGLGIVRQPELVEQLAEIGVVVLLFTVGMELSMVQIARMRHAISVGGGVQVVLTVAFGAAVSLATGTGPGVAIVAGFAIALSSTAVITKLLTDRGELGTTAGRLALGVCVAQDLAVVPMVLALPLVAGVGGGVGAAALTMLWEFAALVALVVVAWFVVPRVLGIIARTRSRELFVLSVIVLCLACAIATAALGLSLALGAFLAGIVLGSSDFHHQAASEVEPIRDALSSLFFVSIGMLFDAGTILDEPLVVGVALLTVIGGKAAMAFVAIKAMRMPTWTALRTGLMLAQVGEFSFVMLQVARGLEVVPDRTMDRLVVVAVLSMAATPLLFLLGQRIGVRRTEPARHGDRELRDHAVVVGFGPAGQHITKALRDVGIPYRIVEFNPETVARWKPKGEPIVLGDASRHGVLRSVGIHRARMLVVATNAPDATRRTVALARRLSPRLHILVRANYLSDVPALESIGADEIVPQELETSVELTARALRGFVVPDDEIARQVDAIREGGHSIRGVAPHHEGERLVPQAPGLRVATFRVEAGSALADKSLGESHLRHETGLSVVAVERTGRADIGIGPETVLQPDDIVVAIGAEGAIQAAGVWFRGPGEAGVAKPTPWTEH